MNIQAECKSPIFEESVSLSQIDPGQDWVIWPAVTLTTLGGIAPFVTMNIFAPTWASSGWAVTLSIIMSVVLAICGLLASIAVVEVFAKDKTFSVQAVKLQVGPMGLTVPGLANVPWSEVLATEGIPDSSTSIAIQTAAHLKWLVQTKFASDMENGLLPVLQHYMSLCANTSEDLVARVRPFKRPAFYFLIVLGYMVGVFIAGLTLTSDSNKGPFIQLIVAIVLGTLTTWIVWAPAFWSLGAFTSKHGWTLQVVDHQLLCINRKARHVVDLREARWVIHEAKGVGYKFQYFKLCAPGIQMCFVSDDAH